MKINKYLLLTGLLTALVNQASMADPDPIMPTVDLETEGGWFIMPSASYTTIDTANFKYGTVAANGATAFDFKTSAYDVMPGISVGREFANNEFLPSIFGPNAALALSFSGINTSTSSDQLSDPNDVFFWGIDGKGSLTEVNVPLPSQNVNFEADDRMRTVALTFSGEQSPYCFNNIRVFQTPSIGLLYQRLEQDYKLSSGNIVNATFDPPIIFPFSLNEDTTTNYYGAQVGDKLEFEFDPIFSTFIRGSLALLHATADFEGNQVLVQQLPVPPSLPTITKQVNDTVNQMTFAAALSAGMEWHLPLLAHLPVTVALEGGANYLEFTPRIVNPSSISNQAAYIEGAGALNPFVTLSLNFLFN